MKRTVRHNVTILFTVLGLAAAACVGPASTGPISTMAPAPSTSASLQAMPPTCINENLRAQGPELTLQALAPIEPIFVLARFEGFDGPARWGMPGQRPTAEDLKNHTPEIYRPVRLTVITTLRGSVPAGTLVARVFGGEIGCDKVHSNLEQTLVPGQLYVTSLDRGSASDPGLPWAGPFISQSSTDTIETNGLGALPVADVRRYLDTHPCSESTMCGASTIK